MGHWNLGHTRLLRFVSYQKGVYNLGRGKDTRLSHKERKGGFAPPLESSGSARDMETGRHDGAQTGCTVRNPGDGVESVRHHMSKRSDRQRGTRTPEAPVAVVDTPAPVVETTPDTPTPVVESTDTPVIDPTAEIIAAIIAGGTTPDATFKTPAWTVAFVAAFRVIAGLPVGTWDERHAAVAAFRTACESAMPNTPDSARRNAGRFTGFSVFESQNALYFAAAIANVKLQNGHFMAAWRAELPHAKCDFLNRVYAWSTLSEYMAGRHGGVPDVPGARAVIAAWRERGCRPADAPVAPTS